MDASEQKHLSWWFERFSPAVSAIAVAHGVLVLPGWIFNMDMFKTPFRGRPGANTPEDIDGIALFLSAVQVLKYGPAMPGCLTCRTVGKNYPARGNACQRMHQFGVSGLQR